MSHLTSDYYYHVDILMLYDLLSLCRHTLFYFNVLSVLSKAKSSPKLPALEVSPKVLYSEQSPAKHLFRAAFHPSTAFPHTTPPTISYANKAFS